MNAAQARAILAQAKVFETYEGPIPEDDKKAIDEADALAALAERAWANNVRGREVETILRLAADDQIEEEKAEEILKEKEIEDAEEAITLPQEKATLEYPAGDAPAGHPESTAQQPPNRGADEEFAPVATDNGVDYDKTMNFASTPPWEGYDDNRISTIKATLYDYAQEGNVFVFPHVEMYERANKDRKRVFEYLKAAKEFHDEKHGKSEENAEGAPTPEGPSESPASHEAESGGTGGAEGGENSGGQDSPREGGAPDAPPEPGPEAPEPGAEDRDGKYAPQTPEEDRDTYRELVKSAEQEVRENRLHVPKAPEEEIESLPHDLTELTDKQLQHAYGVYSALSYRASYLLMVEEAKARNCRQAADEIYRALIVRTNKYDEHQRPKTMTILEAEVEGNESLKRWRSHQHRHEAFASSYRNERDSYNKLVEALSRLETMRHNEWERSGGRR